MIFSPKQTTSNNSFNLHRSKQSLSSVHFILTEFVHQSAIGPSRIRPTGLNWQRPLQRSPRIMASRLSVRILTHAGRTASTCLPRATRLSPTLPVNNITSAARVSQYARLQSISNQRTFTSSAKMVSRLSGAGWASESSNRIDTDMHLLLQASNTRIETDAFGEIEVRVLQTISTLNATTKALPGRR